ncbi:NUDIX domain-containing protein [bacterium]|nr:NUDIX domain-containing protein [bacterium]
MKRKSIRILLINPENKILLFRIKPNPIILLQNGIYWFTPGGGIEQGETLKEAALRELFEETGLLQEDLSLGPVIWESRVNLVINGKEIEQFEKFIVVHTKKLEISLENFTEDEKQCIEKASWFSHEELLQVTDTIYPEKLRTLLPPILKGNYPTTPVNIDSSVG